MERSYRLFFKAFSSTTRFRIITLLREGPRNVTSICQALRLEQSLVSHNLRRLQDAGFVSSSKKGKEMFYELDKENIIPILDGIDKHIVAYKRRVLSKKDGSQRLT